MKVLLIGFGSIGKRHFDILSAFDNVNSIDVVTQQNIKDITIFKDLYVIENLNPYDYFIIASETVKHYEQLKYICSKVINKKILVEKPLYDKQYENIESKNIIYTAYNLRFHPVLVKLDSLLKDEKIYYVNAICGQYLPTWRPEQDYRKSYSADRQQGGGVLRDLSHELDYISWLFGDIKKIDAISTKISDLEINSDDIFTAIAVTNQNVIVNITVDYINKLPMRKLVINTQDITIEADLNNNTIVIGDKNMSVKNIAIEKIERNYTYKNMHQSILFDKSTRACTFNEGKKIMDIIEKIEFKEIKDERL